MRFYTRDAQQQALGFLVNQLSFIEPTVYKIRYPDVQYPDLIPVDTSAPEWSKSITFYSSDGVGKAAWFHHQALDVPLADVSREKFEQGLEMAAVGYRYTLEELGQAMMIPGMNLTSERAEACRRAYDEFVDDKAFNGDVAKGWTGLTNNPNVVIINLANGAGGSPAWSDKTAQEILQDINDLLTGVYTVSNTVEIADTLLLPILPLTRIAMMQVPNTTMTVLQWIMMHNVYTMQTGQPLTVRGVRGLETKGVGGTGRMVAYRRDPQVIKLHIPMPHRFLPPWQRGPLVYDIPGIFRLGGVEIRRPGSVRYADGLMHPAYE